MLELKNICHSIGAKLILDDISVSFEPGKIHMILGPNGSGKSSLLKIFSGETKNHEGSVCYETQDIKKIPTLQLAKKRAVLSQQPHLDFPLRVEEVVMMGRYPHFDFKSTPEDKKVCLEVMRILGILDMSERNYLTLSGGEKQRVQYARVMAQIWERQKDGIRYLFLDEPLNSLDIKYQHEFLRLAKSFLDNGMVLVIIIHDINLAIQYGDCLVFMKDGKIVANGRTEEILTEKLLFDVFGTKATIRKVEGFDSPWVFFEPLHKPHSLINSLTLG